ncbi:MAG TPA: hypothetical protein VD838_12345, partial [Anaeromyxobacteraceae bacterium]|nr:hypothetical protein [Anaeromyxobacteraceae bacterium]
PTGMREAALGLPDRIAEVTRALRDFEAVAKSNDATARDLWAAADVAAQEARVLQDLAAWFRPNPAPRRRGEGAGAATPLSA